ncbi:MAG: deoxyribonuclease IV [Alistipes sp.]|nr:deoxyribonuclease IV [Candidatus Alistipes equi]
MKFIGAHVSISGGVDLAPRNAKQIGATGFAMFTKNQRQWHAPKLSDEQVRLFKLSMQECGYEPKQVLPHDSYLINLGHPEHEGLEISRSAFIEEMQRCEALGLDRLNFHPGAHLKKISVEQSLERVAESINIALENSSGVTAVIENTAGQGSYLGHSIDHLLRIIERVKDHSRVGYCIDTCHAFAAGYDLRNSECFEAFFSELDQKIGLQFLKGMHLNDAMKPFESHVDRHDSIGSGQIGMKCFEMIAKAPFTDDIPLILETPDESLWAEEIQTIKDFIV